MRGRRKFKAFPSVTLSQRGQSTLEFLLLFILGFLVTGAILGKGGSQGGGVPATLKRASPKLALKVQDRLETGEGWKVRWEKPPPPPTSK